VPVSAEVSGRLRALHVTDGDAVKAGALLAEIDPLTYQAEVDQARAMFEGAMHQLDAPQADLTLSAEQYRGQLTQAQALLMRRRAEVQEAETALAFEQARVKHRMAEQRAALSEIAAVRVDSKARAWVDAYPELRFEAEVVSVGVAALSELAEAKPGEFFTTIEQRIPVKVVLHNQNDLLKAGMMGWVGIERHRDRRPSPS